MITDPTGKKAAQVSRALKSYISKNKVTQKELAISLGIDPSAFSKMVNGKAGMPTRGTMRRLYDILTDVGYYREVRHSTRDYSLGGEPICRIRIKEFGTPTEWHYYRDEKPITETEYQKALDDIQNKFDEVAAL